MRRLAPFLFLCVACGPSGPGAFNGTVAGHSFTVKDAVFLASKEIWLSSNLNLCGGLKANEMPKLGTLVKFAPHPAEKGEYSVALSTIANGTATVQLLKLDESCTNTAAYPASSATKGTLKLEHVEATDAATGTFE